MDGALLLAASSASELARFGGAVRDADAGWSPRVLPVLAASVRKRLVASPRSRVLCGV